MRQGHPDPDSKLGGGVVRAVKTIDPEHGSECFAFERADKSIEVFSMNKSVAGLPLPSFKGPRGSGRRSFDEL